MLKTYYTEINPTIEQITKINKTIGVCRFVYNLYLATQQEHYEVTGKFLSGYDFSKWLNNVYVPNNNMLWIKEVSSKAVKKAIINGEQ